MELQYTSGEKKILKGIYILSSVVFLLVIILGQLPKSEKMPEFVKVLPALNAFINGTCSVLLLMSLYFIRKKNVAMHKRINLLTFLLSTIFLLSYVTFHAFGVETRFPADNPMRPIYLVILISHIILAAVVLPMVLLSFFYGLTGKIEKHRKLTRFSWPVWLYVTVTGVVVYLMISPYYGF
jgi:putative membrane protein